MQDEILQRALGDEVRKRRHERELTQEAAADDCHLHVNTLKRMEKGLIDTQWVTLVKVADGLQIPLSELIARVERRTDFSRALHRSKRARGG